MPQRCAEGTRNSIPRRSQAHHPDEREAAEKDTQLPEIAGPSLDFRITIMAKHVDMVVVQNTCPQTSYNVGSLFG